MANEVGINVVDLVKKCGSAAHQEDILYVICVLWWNKENLKDLVIASLAAATSL